MLHKGVELYSRNGEMGIPNQIGQHHPVIESRSLFLDPDDHEKSNEYRYQSAKEKDVDHSSNFGRL